MALITPAKFEDEMRKIVSKYSNDDMMKLYHATKLISDVLVSLGYDAGIKVFVGEEEEDDGRSDQETGCD